MPINFTTYESALQSKLNAATANSAPTELLLLAKAAESSIGNITVSNIQSTGTTEVAAVNAAGTTQVAAVNSAGSTQVSAVNSAGSTQLTNLQNYWTQVSTGAPAALDTLAELATALNNDSSFASTVANSIAARVNKAGDTMTGTLAIGTEPVANNGILQLGAHASVETLFELATISASAPASTTSFDVMSQAVQFFTSNSANNWTLNLRGNSSTTLNSIMQVGQSLTVAVLVTNGGSAYYQTGFQVDGSSVTVRWSGGNTPSSGNANSIDVYSITVIKTANATFTALGAQTRFA
jgi:hypothetical protein